MDALRRQLHDDACSRLHALAAGADCRGALRARIILQVREGGSDAQIAHRLGVSRKTVWRWRTRFIKGGIPAIERDLPRAGRRPILRNEVSRLILETTLRNRPSDAPYWSTRRLAKALGLSRGMVHRVWLEYGIVPRQLCYSS